MRTGYQYLIEPRHESDQRLCCSLPGQNDTFSLYIRNFKVLAGLCSLAGQFVSCLVGDSRRHIFSWRCLITVIYAKTRKKQLCQVDEGYIFTMNLELKNVNRLEL